jgi:hypothetical protein
MAGFLESESDYSEKLLEFFTSEMGESVRVERLIIPDISYDEDTNSIITGDILVYKIFHYELKCSTIQIKDNKIIVKAIDKCSRPEEPSTVIGSGKHIISLLIRFSKAENLELIIESDVSRLKIRDKDFSLAGLYLFTTGKSWYNSLGFYERNYIDNKRITLEFIDSLWSKSPTRTKLYKYVIEHRPPLELSTTFTNREAFTYIYGRLKQSNNPGSDIEEEELKLYAEQLRDKYTELLNKLRSKTGPLVYSDTEPGLESEPPSKKTKRSKTPGGMRRKTKRIKLKRF